MKKNVMLTLVLVLLGTITLSAQRPQRPEGGAPRMTAENRAERMAKELDLTDKQKAEIQALFEKQDAKREEQRAEAKKEKTSKREAFEAERKAQDAELEKIIGKEKFELLKQKRAEQRKKSERKGRPERE